MTKQRFMKIMSWYLIISMVFQVLPIHLLAASAQSKSTTARLAGVPRGPILTLIYNDGTIDQKINPPIKVPAPNPGYKWINTETCTVNEDACEEVRPETEITADTILKEIKKGKKHYKLTLNVTSGGTELNGNFIPEGFFSSGTNTETWYVYEGETVTLPDVTQYSGYVFTSCWDNNTRCPGNLQFTMPGYDVYLTAQTKQNTVNMAFTVDDDYLCTPVGGSSADNIFESTTDLGSWSIDDDFHGSCTWTGSEWQGCVEILGWTVQVGDGPQQWVAFGPTFTPHKYDTSDYNSDDDLWTERHYEGHCRKMTDGHGLDETLRVSAKSLLREYNGQHLYGEGTANKQGAVIQYRIKGETEWSDEIPHIKNVGKITYEVKVLAI